MRLTQRSIHDVILPTAAFVTPTADADTDDEIEGPVAWEQSALNPKSRIESLEPVCNPMWRIDGCANFGRQMFAVPLFLDKVPPQRLDVFLPNLGDLPARLRTTLDADVFFYTRDASRIAHLGLTRHVLRILEHWISGYDNPRDIYVRYPFGSRITVSNLPKDVSDARVVVKASHDLEDQLLSVASLQSLWGPSLVLPPTVDVSEMEYLSQPHDSVSIVEHRGRTWAFKAITSYTKWMYHELKQLLRIPHHPNVLSRPAFLVTKRCAFGGKFGVVGFATEFHVHGSVRDLIPFLHIHGKITHQDETKWAVQLASALLHIRGTTGIYYPDLRLDNIVLSEARDVVMVDFEQRGVWCEFGAPEVNALDHIRELASDELSPSHVQEKYAAILSGLVSQWDDMVDSVGYRADMDGYNVAWAGLTPKEQEVCEVYMLGRVLWCIFEKRSAPQRAAVWQSYPYETEIEFPLYERTPEPIRELIDHCTKGRTPGLSSHIIRVNDQLVLRNASEPSRSSSVDVHGKAREFWVEEISRAEQWIAERTDRMQRGDWTENYYGRPSMQEVHDRLVEYRASCGFT